MDKNCSKRYIRNIYKIITVLISLVILLILYRKVDFDGLREVFSKGSSFYFLLILLSFIPIYILSSWRWQIMVSPYYRISFFESLQLIASSSSLNMILPSRIGSFAKAYFVTARYRIGVKPAISMVIYEKFSDLAATSVIFILASILFRKFNLLIIFSLIVSAILLIFYISLHLINIFDNSFFRRLRGNRFFDKLIEFAEVIYVFTNDVESSTLIKINFIALTTWFVHMMQIIFFFYMLNLNVPILTISVYMLCAIFVGLLPVSFAGVGTRDLTIIYLFKGIITYHEAISIGILSTLRYIIPTIIGVPFLIHIMAKIKGTNISREQI